MKRDAIFSGSSDLSAVMPKDPTKKTVQAHLTQEEWEQFHAIAVKKQWSDKKLNENIIREYLERAKGEKKNPS